MKWKPPSENSIDFRLVLRFPPSHEDPSKPDFFAKPFFALHAWSGGDRYESYDTLTVDDEEWERCVHTSYRNGCFTHRLLNRMKASGEQIDDRITEVHWDPDRSAWRMMRFRDDKPQGNHRSVVENIIQSIADGVDQETVGTFRRAFGLVVPDSNLPQLLSRINSVRTAWHERHGRPPPPTNRQPSGTGPPPPHSRGPQPDSLFRFGPLAKSRFSKVSGPEQYLGLNR
jgi:mRNA guanylyltransferase